MPLRFISFIPFDKNDGTVIFFYLDSYPYFFIFIKFDSFSLAKVEDISLLVFRLIYLLLDDYMK